MEPVPAPRVHVEHPDDVRRAAVLDVAVLRVRVGHVPAENHDLIRRKFCPEFSALLGFSIVVLEHTLRRNILGKSLKQNINYFLIPSNICYTAITMISPIIRRRDAAQGRWRWRSREVWTGHSAKGIYDHSKLDEEDPNVNQKSSQCQLSPKGRLADEAGNME